MRRDQAGNSPPLTDNRAGSTHGSDQRACRADTGQTLERAASVRSLSLSRVAPSARASPNTAPRRAARAGPRARISCLGRIAFRATNQILQTLPLVRQRSGGAFRHHRSAASDPSGFSKRMTWNSRHPRETIAFGLISPPVCAGSSRALRAQISPWLRSSAALRPDGSRARIGCPHGRAIVRKGSGRTFKET